MTFDEVKAEVIDRLKRIELCEAFQSVLLSTDYPQLISSSGGNQPDMDSGGLYVWSYRQGVVDDVLLSNFDLTALNDNNIYFGQTLTISDPGVDVFVIGGAVTINLTGTTRQKVFCLGTGSHIINVSDTANLELKTFQSCTVEVNLSGTASCQSYSRDSSSVIITQNDSAVTHAKAEDDSTLTYTGHDTSYALLRGIHNSNLTVSGTGENEVRLFHSSTGALL